MSKKSKQQTKAKQPVNTKQQHITLADIARSLHIDPKIARAKCRRNRDKLAEFVGTTIADGWVFAAKQREALVEFLSSSNGNVPSPSIAPQIEKTPQTRAKPRKDRH